MKTLAEFIQQLQDDPAFEKQAHAFDHGKDLIAFVKREGYDFTLEQLMSEFELEDKLPPETATLAPAPADMRASTSPRPDKAKFAPGKPEVFPEEKRDTALPERGNDDFIREPHLKRLPQPERAMPPPEPAEVPRPGLFRGGGGRHRGFSAQRLKSISDEEP